MERCIRIIIFLSGICLFGFSWDLQISNTGNNLLQCSFVDSLHGWVVGENGTILYTSNGGVNWVSQNSPVKYNISDVKFVSRQKGWAIANDNFAQSTSVLQTSNGGVTWSSYRFPDKNKFFYGLTFLDSLRGFLVGHEGTIASTTNAGLDWNYPSIDTSAPGYNFPISKIKFFNNSLAVATGGAYDLAGVIWISTNGGHAWKSKIISSEPFKDISFISQNKIILTGGDPEFGLTSAASSNGGINWNIDYLGPFAIGRAISKRTDNEIWTALGWYRFFAVSSNSGKTWSYISTPEQAELYDIEFLDSRNGWAVGKNGKILKYNPVNVSINNISYETPESLALFPNYPNPFNSQTKFKFSVFKNENIKISIFDLSGKEIETVLNQNFTQGTYELTYNTNIFASGIYILKLQTPTGSLSQKLSIIK